jgi:hypothetical protein
MSDYSIIIVTAFICSTVLISLRIILDFIAEYYEP